MLLVVGAEAAVVRATVVRGGVEAARRFAGLHVVANALIVLHISGNEHLLSAVRGAALQHVHAAIFKYNLGFHAPQALRAEAEGKVVVGIRALGYETKSDG